MRRVDPETGAHLVQVFYATDRSPIVDESDRIGMSVFLLPSIAGFVTVLFGLATIFRSRRIVLGLLTLVSLSVTLGLWHSANLKYQKQKHLVEAGNRVYGSGRHLEGTKPVLELGVCEVSVPPDHRVGKIESPSIIRLEFREDPRKHVVLQEVTLREEEAFYEDLKSCVASSARKQAFVFIHGYNVSFEGAVKRTAQITHDLKFDGAPICYSWPSLGGLTDYSRVESNVTWTVTRLEGFLRKVVDDSGATSVHLIAHSMGNRALVQALERMALGQTSPEPVFGQVIMAAPDVDAGEFHDRYAPSVTRLARHVTLYASTNDNALVASTKVHGHTRAGLSGEHLVVVAGVDTVDVSPIDTSLIGHSYYGNNPMMIQDLQALVELGKPAADREWLEQVVRSPTLAYWVFRQSGNGILSTREGISGLRSF
jgi:esterase/lipase superfamily enzyme